MTTLATLIVKLAADIGGFSAEMEKAELKAVRAAEKTGRAWQRMGDQLAGIGSRMTATLTAPIVAGAALSVKAASDEAESWNKVTVVFGNNANAIKEWASDSATSLGISRNAAYQAASSFGNLFVTAGVVPDKVLDMSTSLVKLSGDLASFNNADPTEVLQSIQSALVGQVEPMRKYGVMLSQNAIAAKALELGLIDESGAMSDAAKMQAIYAIIMEQTKTAQGDFINTSSGLANQMRILKADTENIASSIGKILLPYALLLLGWVREAVAWFSALDPSIQKNILIILGLVAALGPLLMVIGSVVSAIGSLIPIVTAIGAAIGAVSAPVWLTIAAIIAVLALLYAAWINNWGGIRTSLEKAWAAIQPIIGMIFDIFQKSINQIYATFQQYMPSLQAAWNTLKDALLNFWNAVSPILSLLGVVFLSVLTVVLGVIVGIINGIMGAVNGFLTFAGLILDGVSNILSGIVNIVSGLLNIIVGIFTGNGDLIVKGLKQLGTGLVQLITGLGQTITGLVMAPLSAILGFIKGFVAGVIDFFAGLYNTLVGRSIIPDMLTEILAWFRTILAQVTSFVFGWATNLLAPFRNMVTSIINFFRNTDWGSVGSNLVKGIASGITNSLSWIVDAARRAAKSALDAAKNILGIHSPSSVAHAELGVPIGQGQGLGWIDGVKSMMPIIQRDLGNLFGDMPVYEVPSVIAPEPSYAGLNRVSTETGRAGTGAAGGVSIVVPIEYRPFVSTADEREARNRLAPIVIDVVREYLNR